MRTIHGRITRSEKLKASDVGSYRLKWYVNQNSNSVDLKTSVEDILWHGHLLTNKVVIKRTIQIITCQIFKAGFTLYKIRASCPRTFRRKMIN
jgi:hypothetical protein